MKHSEALTEQQQLDCTTVLGKSWDDHCAAVLENISKEAARTRLDQTFTELAGLSADTQASAITAMIATLPSEYLKTLQDAAVIEIAKSAESVEVAVEEDMSVAQDVPVIEK